MLSLDDARERICAELPTLPSESVQLALAAGRVLRADIDAPADLPAFDVKSRQDI
jgi:molybdopterin biosynthesis enzyme